MADSGQWLSVNISQTVGDQKFLQVQLPSIWHSNVLLSAMLLCFMWLSREDEQKILMVLM